MLIYHVILFVVIILTNIIRFIVYNVLYKLNSYPSV